MRKFLLLTLMLALTTVVGWAQNIAYVLPSDCSYTNGTLSGFPSESTGITAYPTQTPELNAATWFKENYAGKNKGTFIPVADLATADLSRYDMIWVNVERLTITSGLKDQLGFDDNAINALKSYVEKGGNLYLSKDATFLAYNMGRIGYAPTLQIGSYEQKGSDDWFCTQAKIGCNLTADSVTDRTSHAIFMGLEKFSNVGYWHNAFKLTNAEVRVSKYCSWVEFENANCLKPYSDNGYMHLLTVFEHDWNAQCLSVRGDIGDYCLMDIVEFLPGTVNNVNWKGTILCNGAAHFQWSKCNDGTIPSPITTLASNVMNYLTKNISLYEGRTIDYASSFTANVTLGRSFTTNTKSTIILPFALTADQCASCGTFYALNSVSGNNIVFSPVTTIEANKPYVFVPTSTGNLPTFENVTIEPTTSAELSTSVSGATMTGTYASKTLASAKTNGYYTYSDNQFVTTTGSITVNPFRAYIKLDKSTAAKLNIQFSNTTTNISNTTFDKKADNSYYTLSGIKVVAPVKGVYIHQGKKVIVK